MLPVAVLSGGLGTRVRHRSGASMPKALLPVGGVPFVDLKLHELRAAGADHVVMLVGHGGDAIVEHVGDGSMFDLRVEHVHDPPGLAGTGGAIHHALPQLGPAFIVTYGDTLLDVPMEQLERRLLSSRAGAVMTVLENQDRWETSNVDVTDGTVTAYEKPSVPGRHRFLDYGMLAMRASSFQPPPSPPPFDLSAIISRLVAERSMLAMTVTRRFYDIGNESSIRATEQFLATTPHP